MSEEQLQKFGVEKYGDRLAILAFVAKKDSDTKLDQVKDRLSKKPWKTLSGKKNAMKKLRKFEVGLLHKEKGGELKQVRQPNGGGTRTL